MRYGSPAGRLPTAVRPNDRQAIWGHHVRQNHQQRPAVGQHHRVVVDVDHTGVRVDPLHDLVGVLGRGQAGAAVQVLRDPGLARDESGGANQELTVVPTELCCLRGDLLDTARYPGKELAFIYDPNQASIGVIQGDYFYRRGLKTGVEELVSLVGNDPPSAAVMKGPQRRKMEQLSTGMYEIARYMLLKNKKKEGL